MKTISSDGLARRYASAQRIAWLLDLADGDWSWRAATLPLTLDSIAYPARLGHIERWHEWLPDHEREGGRARATGEVFVPDLPTSSDSLRAELEIRAPVGIAATLRLAWLDPDPNGSAAPAAATFLRGRLTDWRIAPAGVMLTLTDELEVLGARPIGRLLRAAMLPGMVSPAQGQPLPWIFGALEDAPLVPLDVGAAAPLAAAISASSTVIPLATLAGFPASGVVQIDAEMIAYNAIDAVALTLGTPALPATRGARGIRGAGTVAAAHRIAAVARRVPPEGFAWLVADHACLSVGPVRADEAPLDPAQWSAATLIMLGAETAQIVRLPAWPLDADGKPIKNLSARVQGLTISDDSSGALIANPADVISTLLTHARLGALDSSRVDSVNFATIATALAARNYQFARRVPGDATLGELLDGAAEEAGLWIQTTDPIRLVRADPSHPLAVAETLDESRLFVPPDPVQLSAPAGFIPPDAVELVGAPPGPGLGKPTLLFPPELEAEGVIPRRYAMDWLDLTQHDAASDLGELLWRRLGEAPMSRSFDTLLGAALLSAGETVSLTDAALGLDETLAWVRELQAGRGAGASLRSEARARIGAWGPWAGPYCWRFDALNYIRRFSFGAHSLFVVAGQPVALLTRDGTLRLAGRLKEEATISAGPFADPIALSGGWIYCGVGSAGVYAPFLSIDGSGNAELVSAVRERSTLAIDPGGQCHGATSNRFWLSTDTITGALEWRNDVQILHLPGILIENVRL